MSNTTPSNRTLKIAPDRFPFDPEQLRNEWDAHKTCRRPKRRSIERRGALSTIVHPPFTIPSTRTDLCGQAAEVNNCSNRDPSSILPHDADQVRQRSYDRLCETQIRNHEEEKDDNLDVDSSTEIMPHYFPVPQHQNFNVHARGIFHEIQDPFLRRMSQTGCCLPNYVHKYVLRLESSSISKKRLHQGNIMFEEMKQISNSNLLNYVKGKDDYYNS